MAEPHATTRRNPGNRPAFRHCALGTLVALCMAATAACGSSGSAAVDSNGPASAQSSRTTSAPTTTDPAAQLAQDKSDITATIVDLHRLWDEASADPGKPPDELFQILTGALATTYRQSVAQKVATHEAGYLPTPSKSSAEVSDIVLSGDRATALECSVSDFVVTDSATGRVLDASTRTRLLTLALLRSSNAPRGWVIEHATLEHEWEGVAGCTA